MQLITNENRELRSEASEPKESLRPSTQKAGPRRPARVRVKGLEPIRRKAPDPKSGLSTNSNTPAGKECKDTNFS